jgi:hypothetical protein
MSLASILSAIGQALALVSPEVRSAIAKLVGAVVNADPQDRLRLAERHTVAIASEAAAEALIRKGLRARKKKP